MRFPSFFSLPPLALLALALLITSKLSPLHAATYYWDTNGNVAGAGGSTPTGSWANSSPNWITSSPIAAAQAGTANPGSVTTNFRDDLFFSAGTDATGAYAVNLTGTQSARLITIEEGNPTLAGGTLNLISSGGGITVLAGASGAVTSNLNIANSQILNTAAGTTLALSVGTFTRSAGSTLNVQGAGTVTSTLTNFSVNQANGMIGNWATFGTGTNSRYAAFNGTTIAGYTTATAAVDAAALTDTTGLLNYDLAATTGATPATFSANTIRYTGGTATLTPGATSFSVNSIMNAGGGTWTIATNPITIGADRDFVIHAANGGIVISSIIQDNGTGTTPLASALTKSGPGALTLTAANTYTGITYITAGTVNVTNAGALGSTVGHTVINANGSTTTGGTLVLSNNVNIAENITLDGPGDGIASQFNATITASSGNNNILSGILTLNGTSGYRLGVNGGATLFYGLIQRSGTDSGTLVLSPGSTGTMNITQAIKNNNGSVIVHAGGTAILSASNNQIGDVTVQNSTTLRLAANDALNTARNLQIGNSNGNTSTGAGNDIGTLFLDGINQTINALNGFANLGVTPNNATTTERRKITSSSNLSSLLTVGNGNGTGSFDGVIENGTGTGITSFTKIGTGTQTFAGTVANTYTGNTIVNGGILVLAKTAGINAIAGNLTIGDGVGGAFDIVRLTNSDQIANTSVITFNGTGANAGVLRLNNQSETVGGLNSTGGTGIVENESGSAATSTLTVESAANTTQTFSGIIRNGDATGIDGTLAFAKTGTGTQILSGASTYTGGTTVSAGTLLANNTTGSATGNGPIMVATTGTFGGTGIIVLDAANRATINGRLAPGSALGNIESLEFSLANATGASTSGLSFSNATLAFDLGASGASIAATGTSDSLLLTGTVNEITDLAFTGANVFDFGGTGSFGWYKLFDVTAANAFTWSGLTVDGLTGAITGGLGITNLSGTSTGQLYLGNGTNGDFGDIYLQVVPEPSRTLLLTGGLVLLLFRRRR